MPFPGNVWAPDTWDEDAWAADTWADVDVIPPTPSGLIVEFMQVVQITELDKQILSADFSNNVLKVEQDITVSYMTLRLMMFGELMFGEAGTLGGGSQRVYRTGTLNVRNIE